MTVLGIMEDNLKRVIEIRRYTDNSDEYLTDVVVREISFDIYINKKRFIGLSTLPEYLEELAWGFLFSEGIIKSFNEVTEVELDKDNHQILFTCDIPYERISNFMQTKEKTSGCAASLSSSISGKVNDFSPLTIKRSTILNAMMEFQKDSALFQQTGGVHSAAILQDETILCTINDIGRHNAVDKVSGYFLKQNKKLNDCILLSTGRVSSEIVKKAIRLGFPLIISHSAVTSEAVRLAWEYKLYLIAFVRGKRFNLYTGFNQIKII
ncbi:MAG TPA: formate dehydrogenase accessory sulfurtransferase FdhD [Candidatus Cloacimonadota bacterium]|nr:formate dehydrogenase accessory sulfurtransferase FdhD [Candidatus Cloacimonadota bacterium]